MGPGHHTVHGAEGFSHQRISEQLNAGLDAIGALQGLAAEVLGGFVQLWIADGVSGLAGNPIPVGLHHRLQRADDLLALGQVCQGFHAHGHLLGILWRFGFNPHHLSCGQPGGGERGGAIGFGSVDAAGDHGNVVAAGKAEITPVLQGRQGFVAVLVAGVLQRIAAGREPLGAMERHFRLERRVRVAVADLFAFLFALVEQEQRNR